MKVSTKFKVIGGFVATSAMVVFLAFTGYHTIRSSMDLFHSYSQVASFSVATSDMEGYMYEGAYHIAMFGLNPNAPKGQEALKSFDTVLARTKDALNNAEKLEHKRLLNAVADSVTAYKKQASAFIDIMLAVDQTLKETLPPLSASLSDTLTETAATALSKENEQLANHYLDLRKALSAMDKKIAVYALKQDSESKKIVDEQMNLMLKIHDALNADPRLSQFEHSKAETEFTNYLATYKKISAQMDGILDTQNTRNDIAKVLFANLQNINDASTILQNKTGSAIVEQNNSGMRQLLLFSSITVILSLAIMMIIVIGLVRTLKALANYADEISKGHFTSQLTLHEPGELGSVINSMRNIPVVLGGIVNSYKALGDKVTHGYLSERASTTGFQGEYSELIKETNILLSSLGSVLDLISAMVVVYDTEYTVSYMNKSAQRSLGNLLGAKFPEILRTPFGQEGDSQKHHEADIADPSGKDIHLSISATPLTNPQNGVLGAIAVLNDITTISDAYRIMAQVGRDAETLSERVVTAAEELSAQVEQTTQGSETQRSRISSTATAMEEMNTTVMDVAKNAGSASKQSDETRNKANDGAELVNSLVRNINKINGIAATLHKDMQALGHQAEAISGVMDVISDIADQTNLLALNAAIEAARAGEAGRGFSVVADEVRKLAENTMSATSEVGSSIKAIQESANQNIKNVADAVTSITAANEMADASGKALQDIVNLANDNSLLISGIATAAEEQSATSEEINRAVEEIRLIVTETANGMTESSTAVRELSSVAHDLRQLLEKLNTVAQAK